LAAAISVAAIAILTACCAAALDRSAAFCGDRVPHGRPEQDQGRALLAASAAKLCVAGMFFSVTTDGDMPD
jgi:hypothetical protein